MGPGCTRHLDTVVNHTPDYLLWRSHINFLHHTRRLFSTAPFRTTTHSPHYLIWPLPSPIHELFHYQITTSIPAALRVPPEGQIAQKASTIITGFPESQAVQHYTSKVLTPNISSITIEIRRTLTGLHLLSSATYFSHNYFGFLEAKS